MAQKQKTQTQTKAEQERRAALTDAERAIEDEARKDDPFAGEDVIIDPFTGQRISSTNEPDETGSTSGIPPVGPTDMDGDGQPDSGFDEQEQIRERYQDEVKMDAERRGSQAPQQGPEQKRRANSLAEALYPDENVSDEAKESTNAPKADASHA